MIPFLKKYAVFLLVLAGGLLLWWFDPDRGRTAATSTGQYLLEMLLFIPPIMVLVGLLDVWVPRRIVEQNVGQGSGIRGVAISILVATAAAGPLYAGFPVAAALLRKGCRLANVVIFLGTWATIKIPMLMMEIKFLGLPFALTRLSLTLPGIIAAGYLVELLLAGRSSRNTLSAGGKPG